MIVGTGAASTAVRFVPTSSAARSPSGMLTSWAGVLARAQQRATRGGWDMPVKVFLLAWRRLHARPLWVREEGGR
jgi:hypothetical protein